MSEPTSTPEVVGVLGGTFDPPHVGHVQIACEARRRLGLSRTLLLPTAVPPHKPRGELSPAHHREAMLRLATRGIERLDVCTMELDSNRLSYTIETLRRLREGPPVCIPVFILGMDSLEQITSWRSWRAMLHEFDLIVIDRSAGEPAGGTQLDREVAIRLVEFADDSEPARLDPGRGGRIFRLPIAPIPVSSSEVRARVRQGRVIDELVPPAVARYIRSTGLYRGEEKH